MNECKRIALLRRVMIAAGPENEEKVRKLEGGYLRRAARQLGIVTTPKRQRRRRTAGEITRHDQERARQLDAWIRQGVARREEKRTARKAAAWPSNADKAARAADGFSETLKDLNRVGRIDA